MTGKTHLTASILCGSFLFRNNPMNIIYSPFVILGALILDVDADYSLIQSLTYILFYGTIAVFVIYINSNIITILAVLLFIIMSVLFKRYTKHRTLTHSILGLTLYSVPVIVISKYALMYFLIGYISHLVLDLLTKKGVMLLYPCKKIFQVSDLWTDKSIDYTIRLISILLTVYILFTP